MHLVSNTDFYRGALGGCILGLSSSLFLLCTGQITGLSGIAEGLISPKGEDWKSSYILGLCLSGATMSLYFNEFFDDYTSLLSTEAIVAAGLLTGFGTRLGSGCTSGHGLCGLSRRSLRSLVAVSVFMSTGAITVYICHLPDVRPSLTSQHPLPRHPLVKAAMSSISSFMATMMVGRYLGLFNNTSMNKPSQTNESKYVRSSMAVHLMSMACGFSFGVGLVISGMCNPRRVLRFLDFSSSDGWDPTLMAVMMSGVAVNFVCFHVFKYSRQRTLLAPSKDLGASLQLGLASTNLLIDWRLMAGSVLFGIGWGLAGICPGPGLVTFGAMSEGASIFIPSMFAGMMVKQYCIP